MWSTGLYEGRVFCGTVDLKMSSFFMESESRVSLREDLDLNMLGFLMESEGVFYVRRFHVDTLGFFLESEGGFFFSNLLCGYIDFFLESEGGVLFGISALCGPRVCRGCRVFKRLYRRPWQTPVSSVSIVLYC